MSAEKITLDIQAVGASPLLIHIATEPSSPSQNPPSPGVVSREYEVFVAVLPGHNMFQLGRFPGEPVEVLSCRVQAHNVAGQHPTHDQWMSMQQVDEWTSDSNSRLPSVFRFDRANSVIHLPRPAAIHLLFKLVLRGGIPALSIVDEVRKLALQQTRHELLTARAVSIRPLRSNAPTSGVLRRQSDGVWRA